MEFDAYLRTLFENIMMIKLFFKILTKIIIGFLLLGILIFLPAGSFSFFNGWLFIGVLFVPMLLSCIVMMFKNPELLKKRMKIKETQQEQKTVIRLSGLMILIGFIVAGLTFRFSWYTLPFWVVIVSILLFLFSYILYIEVMRENTYLSRIIEVEENQKVIDTGLYSIIRHPMYSATILLFLSIPLILGSVYSFIIFLAYPFIIVKRIKGEEEFLIKELSGYREYMKKVKYRLIPFVW